MILKENILKCFRSINNNWLSFVHVNHFSGIMASVLASSAIDRVCEPRSGQTKHYKIGICGFSAKYVALRRKSKDWLVRNQNNEWSDMSTRELLS